MQTIGPPDQTPPPQPGSGPTPARTTGGRGKGPTITLGICLAAGLAAGIGLMRPGNAPTGGAAAPTPGQQVTATADGQAPGYGAPVGGSGDGSVVAPGVDVDGSTGGTVAAGSGGAIDIANFAFGGLAEVSGGSAITVTNRDGVAHTLTSNDGAFDTGAINGGATATLIAPTTPGTYSFFCSIHPSMQGSVTVNP